MFVLLNLRYFDNLKFLRNGIRILSLLQNFLTVQTLHNQLSLQPTIIQSRINSIIEYEKKKTQQYQLSLQIITFHQNGKTFSGKTTA